MKKEIKQYMRRLSERLSAPLSEEDRKLLALELEKRLEFYKHERVVHLIVTMTFAVMTLLSFIAVIFSPWYVFLSALFLALEIPYIMHYYFLENSVQTLYKVYLAFFDENCGEYKEIVKILSSFLK